MIFVASVYCYDLHIFLQKKLDWQITSVSIILSNCFELVYLSEVNAMDTFVVVLMDTFVVVLMDTFVVVLAVLMKNQ